MFNTHPTLLKDCISLGTFDLCQLLLMNEAHYPWCILVPERENVTEIYQLSRNDQRLLTDESVALAAAMAEAFDADKMNVAALGNIVPQLHIHHIVRYQSDPAWPAPVWGRLPVLPYTKDQRDSVIDKLVTSLSHRILLNITSTSDGRAQ